MLGKSPNQNQRDLILKLLKVLVPTLGLIIGVLGSILLGLVTPNESAIVGCMVLC